MRKQLRAFLGALFSVVLIASAILPVLAAKITTTPSGYTSSSDVEYQYHTSNKYISNWGARGEVCEFLSPNAESYYVGNYTYDVLSGNKGGQGQSDAPSSALYKALKAMMVAEHNHQTNYGETRDLYKYTDCVSNGISNISSFYSGIVLSGTWDSGKTWNREHTWPKSKGLDGNDENDIMMLRPTSVKENSDRGNEAYGEGAAYYDPGESVRGDCARIVLYVYVRWGNTSYMWGTGGVMESMDILLKWMEEDPVDTWEMGRNDAVESITGVRNVFVDYPEYAWLLFGEEIPDDMPTPSGIAKDGSEGSGAGCAHANTGTENKKDATCTESGYTGDVYCNDCGALIEMGQSIQATGNHTFGNWEVVEEATETTDGMKEHKCIHCGYAETETIPARGSGAGDSDEEDSDNQDNTNQDNNNQNDGNQNDGSQDDESPNDGNQDGTNPGGEGQGDVSPDEGDKDTGSDKNEPSNQDDEAAQNNSSDKKDIKKAFLMGTAIVVPSGCAVGVGLRVFLKKRAVR